MSGSNNEEQSTYTIEQIESILFSSRPELATELISAGLKNDPTNPDFLVLDGILHCFLQREDLALAALEKGRTSSLANRLAELLAEYIACRLALAKRLKISDKEGEWFKQQLESFATVKSGSGDLSVSACLIVKDEEKHLDRCLKSLAGKVDEIVIVDTGSTDRTVEIANSFGAKVTTHEWNDDFSAARNVGLELATSRWILWIDADEEMCAESWAPIQEALLRPQFGGYFIEIVNLMDDSEVAENVYVHSPVRLFQRLPDVRFAGRIHEQVMHCFDEIGKPCAFLTGAKMLHFGYRPSEMVEKNKLERTIKMLEREVREDPKDAFQWFNLANTYSVARQWPEATKAARISVRNLDPRHGFGTLAYQILACGLASTGKPEEALQVCAEAREKGWHTILTQFEFACALLKLKRFDLALEAIDECIAMEWPQACTGDYGIYKFKRNTVRGQILSELGRYDQALTEFEYALSKSPSFSVAHYGKGITLERMGIREDALLALRSAFGTDQYGIAAHAAAGRVLASLGRYAESAGELERAWRLDPTDRSKWSTWAQSLEQHSTPEAMILAYAAGSEFGLENADTLTNWGRALSTLGQFEEAVAKYSRAIELDPNSSNAYFNLGDLCYQLQQFSDAATIYEAGLRKSPQAPEAWFALGNCLAQLGSNDGAKMVYGQVLALVPDHEGALHNLEVVSEAA